MRNLEESLFWEIFYRYQAVRSELARVFDVSAATISRSAGVLLSKQLIVQTGATISARGRRPLLLQLNPALAYVAGIELDRDRITAAITDMVGNLLRSLQRVQSWRESGAASWRVNFNVQ